MLPTDGPEMRVDEGREGGSRVTGGPGQVGSRKWDSVTSEVGFFFISVV